MNRLFKKPLPLGAFRSTANVFERSRLERESVPFMTSVCIKQQVSIASKVTAPFIVNGEILVIWQEVLVSTEEWYPRPLPSAY